MVLVFSFVLCEQEVGTNYPLETVIGNVISMQDLVLHVFKNALGDYVCIWSNHQDTKECISNVLVRVDVHVGGLFNSLGTLSILWQTFSFSMV